MRAPEEYDEDMPVEPINEARTHHVLIVANRTAATPPLVAEVRRRVSEGACRFTLLVPRPFWDSDTEESAITLELSIPLLEDAAGGRVEGATERSGVAEVASARAQPQRSSFEPSQPQRWSS